MHQRPLVDETDLDKKELSICLRGWLATPDREVASQKSMASYTEIWGAQIYGAAFTIDP